VSTFVGCLVAFKFMRRYILFLVVLIPLIGKSQVSSFSSGAWENPSTWDCGCVPFPGIGTITISTSHTVTISSTINANTVTVQAEGVLDILTGGRLILANNLTVDPADPFGVPPTAFDGLVNVNMGAILENKGLISSASNMLVFANGSEYQHNLNDGTIAYATWQSGSTCRITGWVGSNSPSISFKNSLAQSFHHFIWDSPNQTATNVQLSTSSPSALSLTTVNGNLIINNTSSNTTSSRQVTLGLLSPGTGTLTIGGDFIVNNNARVNMSVTGTYTVNIGGSCVFSSVLGVAPQYQIVSSSGTTNFNVTGDFTLNSGQVNLSTATGTGNINIGGNLNLNGGVIAKPGTGTGNISFTGAVNHTITKVSGTFSGGNLNVQSGTLNVSGNPLSLAGDISIASGATFNLPATISTAGNINFVSGSSINSNSGTVTLTGSVPQSINANGATLNNLAINKGIDAITVSLTSPLSLSGELSLSSSVMGTILDSNGNLTLLSTSDAATGNARIGTLANGANVTGSVTVQRFMSPEGRVYRYISSPVTASVAQLQDDFPVTGAFPQSSACAGCTTTPSFFYYDATAGLGAYVAYPTIDTDPLVQGRGYAAFVRQDVVPLPLDPITFDLSGPINKGDIALPVFYNASVPSASWNLVGNPYPSSIDWDDASWTKTNLAASIAVRDAGLGIFQYWDGSTGGIANGVIATGQGFWVRTTAASPQLTVREASKSVTGAFFREAGSELITMTLTKGSLYDRAYFNLRDGAQHGLDEFDAPKLVNDNFDFSTRFADTSPLAINSINELACGTELFLDLRFTKKADNSYVMSPEGNYELSLDIAGSEFQNFEIVLEDQFTGAQLPVVSGFIYNFTIDSDPASISNERLKLKFGKLPAPPEITIEKGDVLVSSYETGIQWFLNNEILQGETSNRITVSKSGNYSVSVSIGNCSAAASIDYIVTGIEEEVSLLKIYPNPFHDKIYVDTNFLKYQPSQISIINGLGQEVSNQTHLIKEGENLAYFSLGNLSDGIYFIKLSSREGTKVIKVIKDSK
jgi:hypothetical protein